MYGPEGMQWLDSLPDTISKIAKEHDLSALTPVDNMTFNYVARGYQHNKPIILKISMNNKSLSREVSCMRAYEKHAAKIIVSDNNMMIIQRIVPGKTLRDYFPNNDMAATKILCACTKELHKVIIPKNHNFCHLSELFTILDQKLDIPSEIVNQAKYLKDYLLKSTRKEVLLHGDLHHDNILKKDNGWLVIDPKGLIGDPVYDLATYLCNPIPELLNEDMPERIIMNRINICSAECDIDAQRVMDWLYAKTVLSWARRLRVNLESSYYLKFIATITYIMRKKG